MRTDYLMFSHITDSSMSDIHFTEVAASQSTTSLTDGSEEGAPNEGRLTCDRCGRPFNSEMGSVAPPEKSPRSGVPPYACAEGEESSVES